jgi:hypothetical protein
VLSFFVYLAASPAALRSLCFLPLTESSQNSANKYSRNPRGINSFQPLSKLTGVHSFSESLLHPSGGSQLPAAALLIVDHAKNPVSPLELTLTRFSPVSPLFLTLTKSLDLKSLVFMLFQKTRGGGVPMSRHWRNSYASSVTSLLHCFIAARIASPQRRRVSHIQSLSVQGPHVYSLYG